MGYIAYLDLLGTKDLSTHDADAYRDSIKVFQNVWNAVLLMAVRLTLLAIALTLNPNLLHKLFLL